MRTPHLSRPSHTLATQHNSAMEGSAAAGVAASASIFEKRNRPDRTFAYQDMTAYESTEFMSYPLLQSSEAYSPLPLPPHINLQRASEPASPITIASTLSHTSSPSPSPSRTQPTAEPSHDFLLFDESLQSGSNIYPPKRFQGGHRRFGSASSLASDPGISHTSHPAGQYGSTVFPVIAQQDSFASPAFGNNYLVQSHLVGNDQVLFDMGKQVPKASSRQMLQPPIHFGQSAMAVAHALMQHHGHSDDEDQVPGLSPASRANGLTGSSSRPSISSEGFTSPNSPSRTPDQNHGLPTHSATPRIYASSTQLSPHTPNMSHMSDVQGMISDFPNLFQKAQREHSISQASPSQDTSGHHSAFHVSSPYHPQHDASQEMYAVRMSTAHEQRIKQERDFAAAEVLRRQMENEAANAVTPKTISPKDSLLEYHDADSQQKTPNFFDGAHSGHAPVSTLGDIYSTSQFYTTSGDNDTEASYGSMATSRRESSTGSLHRTPSNQMPYSQLSHLSTQQFPYARSPLQSASQRQNPESFGVMSSVDQPGQATSSFGLMTKVSKPAVAKANIGTYTCTFEGCGQRFTTSAKLQRHRRESHRHASTDGAIGSAMSPAAVAARNAQPGPHKCTRVNPSTGKPCNIVFSRPYDLTRHEDTIHNAGKEKVRCEICTDEKTFSRYDALVRHKRVKHGIVDRH